jgi:hypothetical protein
MNQADRPKVSRTSAIIFAVAGDELLMQSMEHQGGEVLDVFGSFIAEGLDAQQIIDAKVEEKIGNGYKAVPFGKVLDHIEKPEESVDLLTLVFKIHMSPEMKASYVLKDKQFWATKEFIEGESRIRQGDRRIFTRALQDQSMDIELSEDQYEKWIDAKLTSWTELS